MWLSLSSSIDGTYYLIHTILPNYAIKSYYYLSDELKAEVLWADQDHIFSISMLEDRLLRTD